MLIMITQLTNNVAKEFCDDCQTWICHNYYYFIKITHGIQFKYKCRRISRPLVVQNEVPIRTLEGYKQSFIALPSDKNSGLDIISYLHCLCFNSLFINCVVWTGTVDFSTINLKSHPSDALFISEQTLRILLML